MALGLDALALGLLAGDPGLGGLRLGPLLQAAGLAAARPRLDLALQLLLAAPLGRLRGDVGPDEEQQHDHDDEDDHELGHASMDTHQRQRVPHEPWSASRWTPSWAGGGARCATARARSSASSATSISTRTTGPPTPA
jgi:hypothetical protein